MKKIFIYLLCFLVIPVYGATSSIKAKPNEEPTIVPIEKTGNHKEDNPRTILTSPIECFYYLGGLFHFSFLEIFEDVTIRIENRSTGEQWYEFLDFTDSSTEIRTSSSAGTYVISIFTDDGYYSGILHK